MFQVDQNKKKILLTLAFGFFFFENFFTKKKLLNYLKFHFIQEKLAEKLDEYCFTKFGNGTAGNLCKKSVDEMAHEVY